MDLASRIDLKDAESFPSRRSEDWKYTDVRRVLRVAPEPSPQGVASGEGPFAGLADETLTIVNGRSEARSIVANVEGRVAVLRFVSTSAGTGHQAEVAVDVKAGASLTLLESYDSEADGYVANAALHITLGAGARLERVVIADDAENALSFSRAEVEMGEGAAFSQTVLTTGAKLQRLETRMAHPGEGSVVRIDGAYLLCGPRHADLTTEVDHMGPNGLTDQLTKGVVRDEARGVFQGRIIVRRGADGTDARMGHHALITSPRGEVDAKPELLIYADDVSCAHGNTVGALDESALFYMEQRGLPTETARALLTEAFLMEVVDRIGHEGARERARAWLTDRL